MFVALCKQTRDAACASWLNFISAILYIQIRWHFPQGLLRSAQAHRARHKFVLMRHNKLCFFYCRTLSGSTSNHWGAAQLVSSSALWACEAALCAFHTQGETAAGLLIQVFLGWSSWSAARRAALPKCWPLPGPVNFSPPGQRAENSFTQTETAATGVTKSTSMSPLIFKEHIRGQVMSSIPEPSLCIQQHPGFQTKLKQGW